MTTELEQEFFNVFGIEKNNINCPMLDKNNCIFVPSECNYYQYPEITNDILLQIICIINEFISMFNWKQIKYISTFEIETLKDNILKDLIWILSNECSDITGKQLKSKIQQLFKGEE